MKNIYLLGATGSIGTQVLDIIKPNHDFKLKSISVGNNIDKAIEIINKYKPEFVSVLEEQNMKYLASIFPNVEFDFGEKGLIKAATYSDEPGYLINAVVGMVGLIPTIAAIEKKRNILLANKETLVVAGDIIKKALKKYDVKMIPIDSEHSAIYQCLFSGKKEEVKKIIITASGGSFRDLNREELTNVTINDALKHPNWSMGAKITIDSATMVNKGLEVIEAHYLFDMPYENIETVIHRESIIHSMVEYVDGAIIAQLSNPDMRLPIQYALYESYRENNSFKKMDFSQKISLTFSPMYYDRYPLLALAYKVGKMGGIMPMIYNSANEVAVKLFLEQKINFLDIEKIINDAVLNVENILDPTLEQILESDKKLREHLYEKYEVKKWNY